MNEKEKDEKGEDKMNASAMKPQMPFITKNELKRTPATQENRRIAEFLDSHEFSFSIDKVTKKINSSISSK